MSERLSGLAGARCAPLADASAPLPAAVVASRLNTLDDWRVVAGKLSKTFRFPDHHATMAFVNAVAWISHRQDHHPDLSVGYDTCRIEYVTHAIGGLSENDFICAAKIDVLSDL